MHQVGLPPAPVISCLLLFHPSFRLGSRAPPRNSPLAALARQALRPRWATQTPGEELAGPRGPRIPLSRSRARSLRPWLTPGSAAEQKSWRLLVGVLPASTRRIRALARARPLADRGRQPRTACNAATLGVNRAPPTLRVNMTDSFVLAPSA